MKPNNTYRMKKKHQIQKEKWNKHNSHHALISDLQFHFMLKGYQ